MLVAEAAAARQLLGRTRVSTPEPVSIGEPGPDYPMPWSVQAWLPGTVVAEQDVSESADIVHDLADSSPTSEHWTRRGESSRARTAAAI